jgi:hypothetical protein
MRVVLYGGAALGIAALSSPDALRGSLATSASALVEATPFAFAAILLSLLFRRSVAIAYLGCGCTTGPSARSIPVTAATWLIFGPLVAIARCAAAVLVARILRRRLQCDSARESHNPVGQLTAILPAVLLAGASAQLFAAFDPARLSPVGSAIAGALLGFSAAPCGLGAVAVAGTLRAHAPIAAVAFLCVAGIADLRAIGLRRSHLHADHDALAYALLAVALGIVAWRHGDSLVHPVLSPILGCCATAALLYAVVHRRTSFAPARVAPGLMLLGALIGAPPPSYHATETTLTDLFPGERLTFTGALSCETDTCAVVRYAITCCRADAAPVAIRLNRTPPFPSGTWLRTDGRIASVRGDLRLVSQRFDRIAPPSDPFIYR